jgi:hypothetical protein
LFLVPGTLFVLRSFSKNLYFSGTNILSFLTILDLHDFSYQIPEFLANHKGFDRPLNNLGFFMLISSFLLDFLNNLRRSHQFTSQNLFPLPILNCNGRLSGQQKFTSDIPRFPDIPVPILDFLDSLFPPDRFLFCQKSTSVFMNH